LALLQITTNCKLNALLAKGAAYESLPWSSFRDEIILQEMLAERGVKVDHTTIYRRVQRYAPEIEKRLRW
jgi:hypothetical protein